MKKIKILLLFFLLSLSTMIVKAEEYNLQECDMYETCKSKIYTENIFLYEKPDINSKKIVKIEKGSIIKIIAHVVGENLSNFELVEYQGKKVL